MAEFLKTLLSLALQGGVLALLVLVLRLLLQKAPKWVRPALWALVAVRLVVPVSVQTSFSLMPDLSGVTGYVTQGTAATVRQPSAGTDTPAGEADAVPAGESAALPGGLPDALEREETGVRTPLPGPGTGAAQAANGVPVLSEAQLRSAKAVSVLFWLWAAGCLCVLLWGGVSFLRLKRRVRVCVPEDGAYLCDDVPSPFLLGVLRPRVFLPSALTGERRRLALLHERAHIRRGDPFIKLFAFLLLAVYWFQPLFWPAFALLSRDIEAACDERVIRDLTREERAAYAETLLSLSVKPKALSACPLAFGETNVKARVKNVLSYKKPSFWLILAAAVLAVGAAVFFLTTRAPEKEDPSGNGTTAQPETVDPGPSSAPVGAKSEAERAAWMAFYYGTEPYVFADAGGNRKTLERRGDGFVLTENGEEKQYRYLLCTPESVSDPGKTASALAEYLQRAMAGEADPDVRVPYHYAEHWVLTNDSRLNWTELMLGGLSSYYSPERENAVVVYEDFFSFDARAAGFGEATTPFEDLELQRSLTGQTGRAFYLENGVLVARDFTTLDRMESAYTYYSYHRVGDRYTVDRAGLALAACEIPEGFAALDAMDDAVYVNLYEDGRLTRSLALPDSAGDAGVNLAQRLVYDAGRLFVFGMRKNGEGYEDVSLIGVDATADPPAILFQKTYGGSDFDTLLSAETGGTAPLTMTVLTQSGDGDFGFSPDGYGVYAVVTLDRDGQILTAEQAETATLTSLNDADPGGETDRLPEPDALNPKGLRRITTFDLEDGGHVTVRAHLLGWYPYMPPYLSRGMFFTEYVITGYDRGGAAVWQRVTPVWAD